MPTLALLDGHSLAYRAFYALPADLATTSGQVTNAVFGFTSMLIKLLGEESPDAIAVAWDTPGPNPRRELYPDYKAQRDAPPDLFRSQLPLIGDVLEAMEIRQLGSPGIEADDIIATLADAAADAGWRVVVVTGDRDAFQLIGDRVHVLYTRRGISDTVQADAEWVAGRYGVTPAQYLDYAALRGDTSDNLPGVPGVGEKTATKLIAGHGSIEGVYDHLDEQTPRLRENLGAARDQVFLNRELMRLQRDVPDLPADPAELARREFDPVRVREVFDSLAFRTLWDRLGEAVGRDLAAGGEALDVATVTELDPARIAGLAGSGELVVEGVWDGAELAGIAVAQDDGAVFVPARALPELPLADPAVGKVAHDAKPLIRALLAGGLDLRGLAFDTALAAYLANPAQRAPDLADLAAREAGLAVDPATDVPDGPAAQESFAFDEAGPDLDAAGRRAVAAARLVEPLRAQLEARGGLTLFSTVELPLVRVLARMEAAGIGVDREYLSDLGVDLRDRIAGIEERIYALAGGPFNVSSTLQLREILFERLELPVLKKTPKGAPSTDASVLAKLAGEHEIVSLLMEHRELEKLRGTYVAGLLPLIGPDGRIHGRFNQMAAATGRLSSEAPNLQNIPIRREEGRTVRAAFVAPPGWKFVVADYSQIELRILAHLSGDAALSEAFAGGADVHRATAARVFGVAPDEVDQDQRRMAKVINFGLLYGMEAYGLAQRLEISREEAAGHMEAYFSQFPGVRDFLGGIVDEARRSGYTTTLLGRRRYLPELASSNFRQRQAGERMALNAPIQGSAADIIKKAMVELDGELERGGMDARLVLQVHDELVIEAPDAEVDAVSAVTRSVMEGVVTLDVPLTVDLATGRNLAETK